MSWPALAALVLGSYGLKAVGVFALGGAVEVRLRPLVSLIPAALFSALVAVQTFGSDGSLVVDARLAGVGVGAVAVWRRAPFVVVVLVAMAVTAALRGLG
ncbi:MAG: AzlD domain-containing protein [Acidimicrobiales bacterium]